MANSWSLGLTMARFGEDFLAYLNALLMLDKVLAMKMKLDILYAAARLSLPSPPSSPAPPAGDFPDPATPAGVSVVYYVAHTADVECSEKRCVAHPASPEANVDNFVECVVGPVAAVENLVELTFFVERSEERLVPSSWPRRVSFHSLVVE